MGKRHKAHVWREAEITVLEAWANYRRLYCQVCGTLRLVRLLGSDEYDAGLEEVRR